MHWLGHVCYRKLGRAVFVGALAAAAGELLIYEMLGGWLGVAFRIPAALDESVLVSLNMSDLVMASTALCCVAALVLVVLDTDLLVAVVLVV